MSHRLPSDALAPMQDAIDHARALLTETDIYTPDADRYLAATVLLLAQLTNQLENLILAANDR